ncbi:lipopolysaccharide biosynthesis protein [Accumulibacter sp.]|uniref:lipopolysaccharide biosynthesis protein n=1 Tax=Accumulibacter sp. TaxID=2053492 RepID=UPI0025E6C35E|nr:lipopolysaccharide biosynthesis protein [Accumulibacter sp.]MCM8613021.1 lipopolysaccharide biosynthesis protein [Accumulibacter sp.]MCM8636779.1 lipopolysaccharide biosynthesis protein [Accumulibacter sp.]MCM8640430.1 lipopolysaccharide biosynthesis protein [Accumulibacter sp.]
MANAENVPSTGRQLVHGSAWMVGARWAARLIGLVSTVILARLLAPADFGIVAIALIAVGLLETVGYAGVDLALMRPGANSREHFDTAWTIQIIQGMLIAGLLVVVAPWVGQLFSEPRTVSVVQLIALRPLISGFENIGVVAFRKDLDFAKDFRFTVYTKLANFAIVVGAAFYLENYWALAIGMTSGSAIALILSYRMHPYRPRLSLTCVREMWGFSQWLIISRVGTYLNRKTDEFVVGRLLGTSVMGGYHVANELATMPSSELVMPLRRALFPTLSKVAGARDEFANLFCLSLGAIAALCFSVGFGLMAVAPEFVPLVLGEKWLGAIDAMRWLALYGAFSSLILTLEMPLWVMGRTRLSAAQTWLELALLVPIAFLAAHLKGMEGVAMARVAVSIAVLPVMLHFVSSSCMIRIGRLYGALWRPCLAGLAMYGILAVLAPLVDAPVALLLLLKVLAGAVIFASVLVVLWLVSGRHAGIEEQALRMIVSLAGRRHRA